MLTKGLQIVRKGEYKDKVNKKSTDLMLLSSGDGVEVMKMHIVKEKHLSIFVEDGFESIIILNGALEYKEKDQIPTQFSEGDCLSASDMNRPAVFTTLSDVDLLYITSKPMFHFLQDEVKELFELARTIEAKDGYTMAHCDRLQALSLSTGEKLGLSPERLELLTRAALLHDLGKARIPLSILDKNGPLTDEEWRIMKEHPKIGSEMVGNTVLKKSGIIIAQHHERIDGSGYPYGLKEEEITLEAQIVGIADTFDAMTTDRPYKKGKPFQDAVQELQTLKGRWFSDKVVDAFVYVLSEKKIYDEKENIK